MKKNLIKLSSMLGLGLLIACQPAPQSEEENQDQNIETTESTKVAATEESEETSAGIDVEAKVAEINAQKAQIESTIGEGQSISTEGLRAKIQQKWSKIEYYTDDKGAVIRVKTYPHEGISKRTEEFYYDGVNLVLVVIEDDGSAPRSEEGEADKMYYFHEWEPIKEVRKNDEAEQGIRQSDAEELLVEAREYLRIYAEQK